MKPRSSPSQVFILPKTCSCSLLWCPRWVSVNIFIHQLCRNSSASIGDYLDLNHQHVGIVGDSSVALRHLLSRSTFLPDDGIQIDIPCQVYTSRDPRDCRKMWPNRAKNSESWGRYTVPRLASLHVNWVFEFGNVPEPSCRSTALAIGAAPGPWKSGN